MTGGSNCRGSSHTLIQSLHFVATNAANINDTLFKINKHSLNTSNKLFFDHCHLDNLNMEYYYNLIYNMLRFVSGCEGGVAVLQIR